MRFFGSNLAADKTLITVIGNIPAELSVPPFSCHHTLVGSLLRAVDTADIQPLVGFVIVFDIAESVIQILVKIFLIGGLIRITGIVNYFF